jgi:branched-chain amino acid transport system ATP-binding protein
MVQSKENNILSVEGIHLSFDGIKALDDVDVRVEMGKIVSIIGPNGAGKTCLINCITGYYRPQQGRILFGGQDIIKVKPYKITRLGIVRTFQDPTTYPTMTALDILMAGRYTHSRATLGEAVIFFGRSRREELKNRNLVEEIISFVRIEELRKIPLAAMSYGQRKQVEIARALAMDPKLILLDEPMSGLDDVMKEVITELILNMYKKGITVVLIEHDMQAVMELSHSILVLDHGQKIAEGTPAEIHKNDLVVNAYLGMQSVSQ